MRSTPKLAPTCEGIFNLCLGTPVEEATSLLGAEDERYGTEDVVYRYWRLGDSGITVAADTVGSIRELTGSTPDESAFRLVLPGGLILGETSMGQVEQVRGEPDSQDVFSAEGAKYYTYTYCVGGEGSIGVDFNYVTPYTADDPGPGFDGLATKELSSYSMGYGC